MAEVEVGCSRRLRNLAHDCQQKPKARKSQGGSLLRVSERAWLGPDLDFVLLASRAVREPTSVV